MKKSIYLNFPYMIIPAALVVNRDLTLSEKWMLSIVSSVAKNNGLGYCNEDNRWFSELLERSKENVSRTINSLIKKGYLKADYIEGTHGEYGEYNTGERRLQPTYK